MEISEAATGSPQANNTKPGEDAGTTLRTVSVLMTGIAFALILSMDVVDEDETTRELRKLRETDPTQTPAEKVAASAAAICRLTDNAAKRWRALDERPA